MPKIKLSALAADIKGKSQGSVFSKNSGGNYFRNNPSGGGRKSAKWDKRKSGFSSLAQAWKNLTLEEQEAWDAARSLYPTTNAFGEPRLPSGYELFMRLNGSLTALIDPVTGNALNSSSFVLPIPTAPRSVPSPGAITLDYPEAFQWMPNRRISLVNPFTTIGTPFILAEASDVSGDLKNALSLAFRVSVNVPRANWGSNDLQLFSYGDVSANHLQAYLVVPDPITLPVQLILQAYIGEDKLTWTSTFPSSILSSHFHLTLRWGGDTLAETRWFLNGEVLDVSLDGSITETDWSVTSTFFIGAHPELGVSFNEYADIRVYRGGISIENARRVAQGYIINNPLLWITGNSGVATMTSEPGPWYECEEDGCPIGWFCDNDECFPQGPVGVEYTGIAAPRFKVGLFGAAFPTRTIEPYSYGLCPDFVINVENEGIENTFLNIYATPPISSGRGGAYNNYKLLGSYPWGENTSFAVADAYRRVYGSVPPNSEVRFRVAVVDGETGQVPGEPIRVPAKRPKFKAGAELNKTT